MTSPLAHALESAEQLRFLLDRADGDSAEHADWVSREAQMLQHWVRSAADTGDHHPALRAGLDDYARGIQESLGTCPCRP